MTSASGKWWRIGAWNAGLAALVATGIVLGIVLLGPTGSTGARGSQEPPAESLPADAPGLQRAPASARGLAKAALTGTTGALHVLVVRETDYKTPVAGAAVQVVATGVPVRTARTDAGGAATFEDLPRGGWRVSAAAVGYVVSEERTVREDAEGNATLRLALEEAGALHGRVVAAATGRGVAGARVTALEGGAVCINPFGEQTLGRTFGTDTTDPDGGFMVDGVAVSPRCSVPLVRVDASGYRTLWRVAPHPGEDAGFEVRLVPGGTVQGTSRLPAVRAGAAVT